MSEEMQFDEFMVVIYRKGATWQPEITPEVEEGAKGHLALQARLVEKHGGIVAGPFDDPTQESRGLTLLKREGRSIEDILALFSDDPLIQIGRLKIEVLPWYTPKGLLLKEE